jgi:hypothetical protein
MSDNPSLTTGETLTPQELTAKRQEEFKSVSWLSNDDFKRQEDESNKAENERDPQLVAKSRVYHNFETAITHMDILKRSKNPQYDQKLETFTQKVKTQRPQSLGDIMNQEAFGRLEKSLNKTLGLSFLTGSGKVEKPNE